MEERTMRQVVIFFVVILLKLLTLALCFAAFAQLLLVNETVAFTFAGATLIIIAAN